MSFIDEQEQQNRFNETDSSLSDTESDHLFFDQTEEEEQKAMGYDEYFKYDLKQSLIKYPMEIVDALNIPTSFQINLSEYKNRDYQYIFHINIRSKGDESFIGLTDKSSYKSFCNNPVVAAKNAVLAPKKAITARALGANSNKGEHRSII